MGGKGKSKAGKQSYPQPCGACGGWYICKADSPTGHGYCTNKECFRSWMSKEIKAIEHREGRKKKGSHHVGERHAFQAATYRKIQDNVQKERLRRERGGASRSATPLKRERSPESDADDVPVASAEESEDAEDNDEVRTTAKPKLRSRARTGISTEEALARNAARAKETEARESRAKTKKDEEKKELEGAIERAKGTAKTLATVVSELRLKAKEIEKHDARLVETLRATDTAREKTHIAREANKAKEEKAMKDLETAETQLKKLVCHHKKVDDFEKLIKKRRQEREMEPRGSGASGSKRRKTADEDEEEDVKSEERSRSRRGRRGEDSSMEEADRQVERAVLERERELQEDAKDRRSSR